MSNNINNNKIIEFKDNSNFQQCHLMPCKIEYNKTTINAPEYFWPTIKELKEGGDDEQGRERKHNNDALIQEQKKEDSNNPILTASFRGRPLQGKKVNLPLGYKGQVVFKDSDNRYTNKGLKDFYYWNWDQIPDKNDNVVKALQWIELSKVIHDD